MTKDEALDLALEALEFDGFMPEDLTHRSLHAKAITAIKQARALDKKADNARELGLDYGPVPENFMDALRFDVAARDVREWERVDMRDHAEENLGIGTAQPAPVQPVAWKNAAIRLGEELSSVGPDGYYDMTAEQWLDWAMTQQPRGKNSLPTAPVQEPWKPSDTAHRPGGLPQDFIKHEVENEGDWSEWVNPNSEQYFMKCCDCGLVHEMQFKVVKYSEGDECEFVADADLQAVFRARRATPSAAPVQEPDWKAEYLKSVESGCTTLDELREARAELDATNRQVEILSDALAESRREVVVLKAVHVPHKGLSEHLAQATNGRVYVDPVTGDVGIGTPAAPVREPVAQCTVDVSGAAGPSCEPLNWHKTAAQPAVPDAIHHTDLSETLEYIQGWNECRQAMLEMMK